MSKKITAVLLTLCMVLGMLPMFAFAAVYKDSTGKEYTVSDVANKTTGKYDVTDASGKVIGEVTKPEAGSDSDSVSYYEYATETTIELTLVTVTVTFDPGANGTIGSHAKGEKAAYTIGKGTTYSDAYPTPTWTGHKFEGWATTKDDAKTIVTSGKKYDADTTLYAIWSSVVEVKPETKVESGAATATVKEADIAAAEESSADVVEIVATKSADTSGEVKSAEVTISKAIFDRLATLDKPVDIKTDVGSVSVPADDMKALAKLGKANVAIKIAEKKTDVSNITPPATTDKAEASVDISLTDGTNVITEVDKTNTLGLKIKVAVKHHFEQIDEGKKPAVWFNDNGTLEAQGEVQYDGTEIKWTVTHFSPFVIGQTLATTPDVVVPDTTPAPSTDKALGRTPGGMGYTYTVTPGEGEDVIYQVTLSGINSITLVKAPNQPVNINVSQNATVVAWTAKGIDWSTDAETHYFTHDGDIAKWSYTANS